MRLTGSVKAAENYVFRSFWKEMEIKMHCFKREEAGVKSEDTIRMYNELVRNNDLVFLIVGVHSLFTSTVIVSSFIRSKSDSSICVCTIVHTIRVERKTKFNPTTFLSH